MTRAKKKISVVTQVAGTNTQIFSCPKATTHPLPAIKGPMSVSFKREDEISGMAVGPVIVIEREPYEAWLKKHSIPNIDARGLTRLSPLFGSEPDGKHNLGWVTRSVADEIAAHYGVTLEEF